MICSEPQFPPKCIHLLFGLCKLFLDISLESTTKFQCILMRHHLTGLGNCSLWGSVVNLGKKKNANGLPHLAGQMGIMNNVCDSVL